MAIRSKYLEELFIQCQLPFFPFPLLMMLCLVNFLFPQVEGIKWTCRGSLHKINPRYFGLGKIFLLSISRTIQKLTFHTSVFCLLRQFLLRRHRTNQSTMVLCQDCFCFIYFLSPASNAFYFYYSLFYHLFLKFSIDSCIFRVQ